MIGIAFLPSPINLILLVGESSSKYMHPVATLPSHSVSDRASPNMGFVFGILPLFSFLYVAPLGRGHLVNAEREGCCVAEVGASLGEHARRPVVGRPSLSAELCVVMYLLLHKHV